MNSQKVKTAIDHNAHRLTKQLVENFSADVEWQIKSIERLLKEKKKLSRLYNELRHVDIETEQTMKEYMRFLNDQICRIIDIKYTDTNNMLTPY